MEKKSPVIEIEELSKTYNGATSPAIRSINLKINAEEKVGLIGANGSGKTTLLRLLINFVVSDAGKIWIMGENNLEKSRRFIGFVPERQEGMESFTPRELLEFSAKMYGLEPNHTQEKIQNLLEFTELTEWADHLLSGFSKGMAQRIQLALALIHEPQILLLDEPMSGLDPQGQKDLQELLTSLSHLTIIYASHQLEEIERFCSTVLMLHRGEIVRRLDLEEIQQEIFTMDLSPGVLNILPEFSELNPQMLSQEEDRVRIQVTTNTAQIQKFISALNAEQVIIKRLRSTGVLQELYHRYVSSEINPN